MIDPNQPAFPETHIHHYLADTDGKKENPVVVPRWMGGLSKRELLAAIAMLGYIASHRDRMYDFAVKDADGLIAELSKAELNK